MEQEILLTLQFAGIKCFSAEARNEQFLSLWVFSKPTPAGMSWMRTRDLGWWPLSAYLPLPCRNHHMKCVCTSPHPTLVMFWSIFLELAGVKYSLRIVPYVFICFTLYLILKPDNLIPSPPSPSWDSWFWDLKKKILCLNCSFLFPPALPHKYSQSMSGFSFDLSFKRGGPLSSNIL